MSSGYVPFSALLVPLWPANRPESFLNARLGMSVSGPLGNRPGGDREETRFDD